MISVKSAFKKRGQAPFLYIDREKSDLLVLVPGWASDWRIFRQLDLEFNYLLPLEFSPFSFEQALLETLKVNSFKKISLFGWSLGGFLAAEFAAEYPDRVKRLILAGVRKRYSSKELRQTRTSLKRNRQDCLHKFYNLCFAKGENPSWFRQNLLSEYCQGLKTDYLLAGLDYLENAQFDPASLNRTTKIQIIHGEDDAIAPIDEVKEIKGKLPQAELIAFKKTGHMPFLKKDLSRYL